MSHFLDACSSDYVYTDAKFFFLSKTQLLMINQLQDVLTRKSLSTAYSTFIL